jgi:hypothetical protein
MSVSAISSVTSSTQQITPPQLGQDTSGQQAVKGGGHHGGHRTSQVAGTQTASTTSGTSSTLAFNPATGSMEPIGSFSTSTTAGATTSAPGVTSTPAATTQQNAGETQPSSDTVELTGPALAKSLELSGQTPTQIATQLGLNVQTVDGYLGIQATTATPATYSAPQVIKTPTETSATPQSNSQSGAATGAAQG